MSIRYLISCANCNKKYERFYKTSKTRLAANHYCSIECRKIASREKASARVSTRFWSRVERRGIKECWLWTGRLNDHGYATLDVGKFPRRASRISFEIHNGYAPGDLIVCHSCDNPKCVNPHHLWLGSLSDNAKDAFEKGRIKLIPPRGEANKNAKLTEEQVIEIKNGSEPAKSLALRLGVTTTTIYTIRNGLGWRHV